MESRNSRILTSDVLINDSFFLILLVVFFLVRIYSISTPGLYADEIYVPYVALQTKLQVPSLHSPFIDLFGYKLPLGISPQSGGFPIYPQLLLLYVTDNPFAHRVLSIVYACLFIIFFYAFLKSFFNKRVALLTFLFLTFMPSHIFYSRTDPYFILRLTILSVMFYAFHKWYTSKNWKFFYVGCLATGLGLSTRLEMVMFITAFPLYLILLNRELLKELIGILKRTPANAAAGLVFFLLGSAFFILFNVVNEYSLVQFFERESVLRTADMTDALKSNIGIRLRQIKAFFNCGNPFGEIKGRFCNSLPFYMVSFSLVAITAIIIFKRLKGNPDRKMEFLILTSALIFLQSLPSISLGPFHNLIVLPLLVAIFSYSLSLMPRYIYAVPVVLVLIIYIKIDFHYYKTLKEHRENPIWSSASIDLVKRLESEGVRMTLTGDWGLARLIFYISKGKIEAREIFGYGDSSFFLEQMDKEYYNTDNVYVFYSNEGPFNQIGLFRNFLKERSIAFNETVIIDQRGEPVYLIYRLTPGAKSSTGRQGTLRLFAYGQRVCSRN